MRSTRRRLLGILSVLLLLAAGCGGDDGDDEGASPTGEEAEENAPEPVHGGTLVYGVEADTAGPWRPQSMACASACYSTVGRTVFEPLTISGTDGKVYPYLLESITPNENFTEWTLVVRDGITFHDGTPLDAPAITYNLQQTSTAALTGPAVRPIQEITDDGDRTVTVRMSEPWPAFDLYLSSQLGLMASPTWLRAVEAQTADPTAPVGTGPFKFVSYESGENGRFRAERYEGYWRGDGPGSTGEGLPYLDAIEVRFIPDSQARSQALLAGDIDLAHFPNGTEIADFQDEDEVEVELMDHPGETETAYLLMNQLETLPDGTANPFADVRVRRALAHATDREALAISRAGGVYEPANGPFPPGRIGYLEDTGYPDYDPDAARDLLEEVEADTGRPVSISLKTTTDSFNLTTAEVLEDMWEDAGFEVSIDQIPQGEFISAALAGDFQVFTWRNHPGADPDAQYIWWSSTTTQNIAINFGRIRDERVDELLEQIRTETDPDARRAAAEDLNRYFAEQVFDAWLYWVQWGHVHRTNVHNVGVLHIPGAPDGVTALHGGTITPIEIFKTG
jgi:peptide/nickel transport system substrate-binding protein